VKDNNLKKRTTELSAWGHLSQN